MILERLTAFITDFNWLVYGIPQIILIAFYLFLMQRNNRNNLRLMKQQDNTYAETVKMHDNFKNEFKTEIGSAVDVKNDMQETKDKIVKDFDDIKNKANNTIHQLDNIKQEIAENKKTIVIDIKAEFKQKMADVTSNMEQKLNSIIENSKVNEINIKLDEYNQNLKIIINYQNNVIAKLLNDANVLFNGSVDMITETVELTKKQKLELSTNINNLKVKLSQSRGDEYKQALAEYNKLKEMIK